MFKFKSLRKSIYITSNYNDFVKARDILALYNIDYKYRTIDHSGKLLAPGRGTIRSIGGTLGMNPDARVLYELFVNKKDYDQAAFCLRSLHQS